MGCLPAKRPVSGHFSLDLDTQLDYPVPIVRQHFRRLSADGLAAGARHAEFPGRPAPGYGVGVTGPDGAGFCRLP